jgi:hypothetical protein
MPRKGGKNFTGQYGCTIIPSLIVGPDGKRDKNFVTKFFYTPEAYSEEKASTRLVRNNVDRNGEFTNSYFNEAPIDRSKLTLSQEEATAAGEEFENNAGNCKAMNELASRSDFNTLPYLNYRNLGTSFEIIIQNDIQVDFETSKQIFRGLDDLLYRIINSMNKKGFFHNYVHYGNVTYSDKTGKCYLIDFDLEGYESEAL